MRSSFDSDTKVKSRGMFLELNRNDRTVKASKRVAKLSPLEFDLLLALAAKFPEMVTYRELLELVWGSHASDHKNYLKLYVYYLRLRLEEVPSSPQIIVTERRRGYRLTVPVKYVQARSGVR